MKTEVIPVVVGALGTIKKGMVENIRRVSERATVTETQKISMLGSARILRKVLNVCPRVKFVDALTVLEIVPCNSPSVMRYIASDIHSFAIDKNMRLNAKKCKVIAR